MDNRRLILVMIFSFSLVMLWDAWQQYKQPKLAPAQAVATTRRRSEREPAASSVLVPSTTAAGDKLPFCRRYWQGGDDRRDYPHHDRSLYRRHFYAGGDLVRLELNRYTGTADKKQNFVLIDPEHRYAAQSGLIGEGLPNHRSTFKAIQGA